jgi:glycerol-3-phosphate O-acyltransferase
MDRARRPEDVRIEDEVVARVVEAVLGPPGEQAQRPIDEVIKSTVYHERSRLLRAGDDERARADRAFVARVLHELPHATPGRERATVREIVERYVSEIAGHFDPRVYLFATRVLPHGLSALMQRFSPRGLLRELRGETAVDEHILIEGEVEPLRELVRRGTVILVPTHSSNLDSLLIGHVIHRMGLPPFVYGAGLNLFTNPTTSFFMHNLGAYTVDRTKTDPLYRDTLKEYATVSLELGQHNLFFPGGTRSRSGELETRVKLGLLGTSLAAYRNNLLRGKESPGIFIVPCTIAYPLVLEAATLVRAFLEETGRSGYIAVDDEFGRIQRWIDFLRGISELDMRVHVRIGRALDSFGNEVDARGTSRDPRGRPIDAKRYLLRGDRLAKDPERDAEYTRGLGERVVATYHRDNTALPTNVLAFALLELYRRDLEEPDPFRLLRRIGVETAVARSRVEAEVEKLLAELRVLRDRAAIHLDEDVRTMSAPSLVDQGLGILRTYHTTAVVTQEGQALVVLDPELLFYYRNRLEGYGLLGAPRLFPPRRSR